MARWRVDARLWREFQTFEAHLPADLPPSEWPPQGDAPAEGVEIVIEPDAVWIAGNRVSLPLRGTPEVLSAELKDLAHAPTHIELRLKHPAQAGSGQIDPAHYTRLAIPVPGPAWREARKVVAHFNRDVPGKADFFHGRGDGQDPEDLSRCANCGHETYKLRSECEICGTGLQSRRWARRFGFLLVVCGLILSGLMAAVLYFTLPALMQPGVRINGTLFAQSAAMAAGVTLLLFTVFTLGVGILGYGVWQMVTGKASLRVARIAAFLLSGLMMLASVAHFVD